MNIADNTHPPAPVTRARSALRFAQLVLAMLGGVGITLLVIAAFIVMRRGPLTPLNADLMQSAEQRWTEQNIGDYIIEIRVTGRQASTYHVEVRNGEPQRALRNGKPLAQRRTWSTWTVPGMFGTLRADLRNIQQWEAGDKSVPHLTVQVQFDEQYGIPRRYVRVESTRMGGNPEVTWEVTRFEVGADRPPKDADEP